MARLAAEHIEVVTTRPADVVGAVSARRLGVVAIDPSSFDAEASRDAEGARGAARDGRARTGAAAARARSRGRDRARSPTASLSGARSCTHWPSRSACCTRATCSCPPLSTPRLAAIGVLATAPALVALRAGRRLGLLALRRPHSPRPGSPPGSWPSAAAPLGGLDRASSRTRRRPGSRSCCRLRRTSSGVARGGVARAVRLAGALAWVSLARPRPLAAALLAGAPFVAQRDRLRAAAVPVASAARGRACARVPVHGSGCGRRPRDRGGVRARGARRRRSRSPPCRRPRARGCCPGRRGRSRTAGDDASAVDLVWDMRYQPLSFGKRPVEVLRVRAARPSYWRAIVLSDFDGLRFLRAPQPIVESRERGGVVRLAAPVSGATLRAEVQVEAARTRSWSRPASPSASGCRPRPARSTSPRTPPRGSASRRRRGSATSPRARIATLRRARSRALGARYPESIAGGELSFAGEAAAGLRDERPRARPGGALPVAPRRPDVGCVAGRLREGANGHARRDHSLPGDGLALEAWLRTTRAYDEHASLPDRPDALALWAAGGTAGYCQMFAASLAALVRLAGVPARVAEGFAPGELRGGVYHVTDRDAHAWVEAWFPGATAGCRSTRRRDAISPARASSSSAAFDGAAAQALRQRARARPAALRLPLLRACATCSRAAPLLDPAAGRACVGVSDRRSRLAALGALRRRAGLLERVPCRLALPRDPARRARAARTGAFAADQGVELAPRSDAARAAPPPSSAASVSRRGPFALGARALRLRGARRGERRGTRGRRRAGCCAPCAARSEGRAGCAAPSRSEEHQRRTRSRAMTMRCTSRRAVDRSAASCACARQRGSGCSLQAAVRAERLAARDRRLQRHVGVEALGVRGGDAPRPRRARRRPLVEQAAGDDVRLHVGERELDALQVEHRAAEDAARPRA